MEGKSPPGRPRVSRKAGERSTLSLRIPTALFDTLDAEAKRKGVPLSNEAEERLAITFSDEGRLGGPKTASLLREFAGIAARYQDGFEGEGADGWLADRDTFNIVTDLWLRQLQVLRENLSNNDQHDLQEFRADIERADRDGKRALRRYAKKLADMTAIDPDIRREYARLAEGDDQ